MCFSYARDARVIRRRLMMKILVAGGFDEQNKELLKPQKEFAKLLGREIISQGHVLLNACLTTFDAAIAESAYQTAEEEGKDPNERIVSYVLRGPGPRGPRARSYVREDSPIPASRLGVGKSKAVRSGANPAFRCGHFSRRIRGNLSRRELDSNCQKTTSANYTFRRNCSAGIQGRV